MVLRFNTEIDERFILQRFVCNKCYEAICSTLHQDGEAALAQWDGDIGTGEPNAPKPLLYFARPPLCVAATTCGDILLEVQKRGRERARNDGPDEKVREGGR